MSQLLLKKPTENREAIVHLFETKSPILVEVQFPGMATSSDWFLCQDFAEYENVTEHLASGVKLRLTSVFDINSRRVLESTR